MRRSVLWKIFTSMIRMQCSPQKRRSEGPKTCTRIAEVIHLLWGAKRPACIVRHSGLSAEARRSHSETSKQTYAWLLCCIELHSRVRGRR
jgi:hypothetical protein